MGRKKKNKGFIPIAGAVEIEVIKSHDGLEKGYRAYKPEKIAKEMIKLGYWRAIVNDVSEL